MWKAFNYSGIPVYIHVSVFLLLPLIFLSPIANSDGVSLLFVVFLSLFAHEVGHAKFAQMFGCLVDKITVNIMGGAAHIRYRNGISPIRKFLVYAAGPGTNLALAGLGWVALTISPVGLVPMFIMNIFDLMIKINFILAAFNLLPALPLDGGRMVDIMLAKKYGSEKGTKYLLRFSLAACGIALVPCLLLGRWILAAMVAQMAYAAYSEYREVQKHS